ncbi:hypothetical protein F5Y04DRAFT_285901 [Hypomontagnella monticulosa]|nr:hypothetical protein F5Y04DRAFT_285901 [Hypomontagnella monticulosa]
MPSPSENPDSQASGGTGGKHSDQPSYMLEEYVRADPTIIEELSGAARDKKHGKGEKKKTREDKAKEAIKDFDDAWKAASN